MSASDFLAKHAARIHRDPLYGCWIFRDDKRKDGGLDRDGYGTIWTKDGPRRAHLEVYRELVGPIPPGLVLDHNCRRRACCRPAHLEPIKGSENDLRRSWRYRSRKATCPRGHSLALCIVTSTGGRLCRTCQGPEPVAGSFAGIDRGVGLPLADQRIPTIGESVESAIASWRMSEFKP